MRVVVDFDKCKSNAVCQGIAPDVFEVRADGFLYILDENPAEDRRSQLEETVRQCPTGAISLED